MVTQGVTLLPHSNTDLLWWHLKGAVKSKTIASKKMYLQLEEQTMPELNPEALNSSPDGQHKSHHSTLLFTLLI